VFGIAGLLVAGFPLLLIAARRKQLAPLFAWLWLASSVVWCVSLTLYNTDAAAGGALDCWPDCSTYQNAINLGLWLPPLVLVVLAILILVSVLRRRKRRSPRRLGSQSDLS